MIASRVATEATMHVAGFDRDLYATEVQDSFQYQQE
jgi:hypothetical protein